MSRRTQQLPILTFHALADSSSVLCYPPELFRIGMERLSAEGFRTLTVAGAAAYLREGRPWPDKSMVITFDDGYSSVSEIALPILANLGYCATLFLTAGAKGGSLEPMNGIPRLNWRQIRELHDAGVEIGAHTMTHPNLTRIDPARVDAEAGGSRAAIEERIGARVVSFAYPYGFQNDPVRAQIARHFACACGVKLGLVTEASDPFALERVEMHYLRSLRTFSFLTGPGLAPYLRLRRLPRQFRHFVGQRTIG